MLSVDGTGSERVFGRPRPGKDVRRTFNIVEAMVRSRDGCCEGDLVQVVWSRRLVASPFLQ